MTGKQQLVGFIGVALIIANLVTNRDPRTGSGGLVGMLFQQNQSRRQLGIAHIEWISLLGEAALLVFLVILAGVNDGLANIAVVFTLGLALLWAMVQYGGFPKPAAAMARSTLA